MGRVSNFRYGYFFHLCLKIYVMDIFFQPIPSQPSHILHIIHNIPPHTSALLCYNLTIKREGKIYESSPIPNPKHARRTI